MRYSRFQSIGESGGEEILGMGVAGVGLWMMGVVVLVFLRRGVVVSVS
jgi:hypothetical protein